MVSELSNEFSIAIIRPPKPVVQSRIDLVWIFGIPHLIFPPEWIETPRDGMRTSDADKFEKLTVGVKLLPNPPRFDLSKKFFS